MKKLVSRAFDLFWLVFISAVCTISCAGCMSFFSFTETVNVLLTGRERVSKMTRTKEQCSYKEWQLFLNCYIVKLTLKNHIDFYQPCLGPWPGTCTVLWWEKRREKNLVKLCNLKTTLLFKVNGKWKLALPYTFRWTYLMMETSKTSALRVAWISAVLNFCMEVSRLMCLSINVNNRFFVHHTVNICSGWHQDFV